MKFRRIMNMSDRISRVVMGFVGAFVGFGSGAGTVSREVKQGMRALKNPPRLCVDVGGHSGDYTASILKRVADCEIVIFEPQKSNFEAIKRRFAHDANVRVEAYALSDLEGSATIHSDSDGSSLASLTKRRLSHHGINFDHVEEVSAIRFEDYWRNQLAGAEIALCKIDVEGHELGVLRGFGESLEHINIVQFEFGGCNIDTRTFFQDFYYFFVENGFDLFRISPIGLVPIVKYHESLEVFRTTNYLAIRK